MHAVGRKTIGILGGMGPEATVDLFRRILRATPARCDQEHLHLLIDNDPSVPDRTEAIVTGQEARVVEKLTVMARRLEAAGADLLIVPCNTAHYFLREVSAAVSVPFIDMIDETVAAVQRCRPAVHCVGLLATTGTLRTRLYHDRCARVRIEVLQPDDRLQESVMTSVHAIKADGADTSAGETLQEAAATLIAAGAQGIIAGCTEVPLALTPADVTVPFIDATQELAEAAVRAALPVEDEGGMLPWSSPCPRRA